MKYSQNNEFKAAATSYLFVVTPFLLLILIKVSTGKIHELLLTGDWSIASAMIYSSSLINVQNASYKHKGHINQVSLGWFMAVTILMSSVSVALYVISLVQPNQMIGVLQIVLFIGASLSYIKNARLALRLKEEV